MARLIDRAGRLISAARDAAGSGASAFSRGYDAISELTNQPGEPIEYRPFDPGTVSAGAVAAKALTALLGASRARANRRRELEHQSAQDEYLRARTAHLGQPTPITPYQREWLDLQKRQIDARGTGAMTPAQKDASARGWASLNQRSHASDIARAQAGLNAEEKAAGAFDESFVTTQGSAYAGAIRHGSPQQRLIAARALGVDLGRYDAAPDVPEVDAYTRLPKKTKEEMLKEAYGSWAFQNTKRRASERAQRFLPKRRALTAASAEAAGVNFGDEGDAPDDESSRFDEEAALDFGSFR